MTTQHHAPPHELASLPYWLVWRLVFVEDHPKPRKVPYYTNGAPRRGSQCTDEDRAQLVTYEQAAQALRDSNGYYTGVGFALQPDAGIVALDFDDCVVDGVIAAHVEKLCEGTYTELSPSGVGVRSFFRGTLMSKKDVKAERGPFPIEVFGSNGFVTFTGNATETCRLFGWDETLEYLTPAVLQMYRERGWDAAATPGAISDNPLALLQPTLDITDAQVAETLQQLDPALSYEDWIKVGMAVHQQTHGRGFDLWHNWSKQSPKYVAASGEKYNRERWESFGNYTTGAHITFAWVMKQASEYRVKNAYAARDEVKARIDSCDNEYLLREKMCPEIARDERLDHLARESLAKILRTKLRGLGGDYPIAECRRMIAPQRVERVMEVGDDLPEWARGWVWVNDHDKFYHCGRAIFATQQSFNAAHNRHMPRADGAANAVLKSASAVALEDYQIPSVTRAMYLPWANMNEDGVYEHDGIIYVNLFRKASVPRAVATLSDEGNSAVRLVLQHLYLICGGRTEVVEHIVSWMAYCVQHPGMKIRHAILIKGIEGDGKSLIGSLMSQVLGLSNVKQISPKVLGTDFSDWAHGACLGVLEEIRLAGHNRHDIHNALKPYITNDNIAVHPKGKAEVNVMNTMNYLAFTNHNDALPLSDTDRRWMVIFTRHSTTAQLNAALTTLNADGPSAYWKALHGAIASQPAELRRWLLDYRLSASFDANGTAPMTIEKEQMQRASASPEEELVREIIAEGAPGVGRNVLSSTSLLEAAAMADSDVSLQTTTINRVLNRLGWMKVSKRVKWKNRLHRVWTLDEYPSCIQDALDATCGVGPVAPVRGAEGLEEVSEYEDLF